MSLTILVTGANKGIGFEVVRKLLTFPFVGTVAFTSRDPNNGDSALKKLELENARKVKLVLLSLDLTDKKSLEEFYPQLVANKLVFDRVIFNAGVAFWNVINPTADAITFTTNLYANIELTHRLIAEGRVAAGGRFIYVSSTIATLTAFINHKDFYTQLSNYFSDTFTEDTLVKLARRYETDILDKKASEGLPKSVYLASKLFLTIFAAVASRKYKEFKFYACCPGWCQTDLVKGKKAPRTAEEGADTPVFLATQDLPDSSNGKLFYDRKEYTIFQQIEQS